MRVHDTIRTTSSVECCPTMNEKCSPDTFWWLTTSCSGCLNFLPRGYVRPHFNSFCSEMNMLEEVEWHFGMNATHLRSQPHRSPHRQTDPIWSTLSTNMQLFELYSLLLVLVFSSWSTAVSITVVVGVKPARASQKVAVAAVTRLACFRNAWEEQTFRWARK